MEWTKITKDNVDEIRHLYRIGKPIHFAFKCPHDEVFYGSRSNFNNSFDIMVECGRYYYIVLPELK